ncbi:MAG TPA: hypothetical protein VF553_12905 [Pyrinomonadaceae bacterium]
MARNEGEAAVSGEPTAGTEGPRCRILNTRLVPGRAKLSAARL